MAGLLADLMTERPGTRWNSCVPGRTPGSGDVREGHRRFSTRFTFLPAPDSSSVFHSFDELSDV